MSYMVLDIEVDAENYHNRFCDSRDSRNKIVMLQVKREGQDPKYKYEPSGIPRELPINFEGIDVLVGQNIKFDLGYLWDNPSLKAFLKRGGKIWDTKVAEFILQGKDKTKSYSLTDIAKEYGLQPKDDRIKQWYYDKKIKSSEIPKDLFIEYGVYDVVLTEQVYLKQLKAAKFSNMKIFEAFMEHTLALAEMEYNGLHLDRELFGHERNSAEKKLADKIENFRKMAAEFWTPHIELDLNSSQQISTLLFGGKLFYESQVPNPSSTGELFYKTGIKKGELRTKKGTKEVDIEGCGIDATAIPMTKDGRFHLTSDGYLKQLDHPIVKDLLEYRKEAKLLSTYYIGFLDAYNGDTQCIHSIYSITTAATGRVSSTSPNLQNVPPSITPHFISRFKDGVIISADYSQVEIRVLANITKDPVLIEEIKSGKDIYIENAKILFKTKEVSKEQRKVVKALILGITYGKGAVSMASELGETDDFCREFITLFYNKYRYVAQWHEAIIEEVNNNTSHIAGTPFKRGYLVGPGGNKFCFKQTESPSFLQKKGIMYSFTPTQIKNYPVQGTAALIMALAAGIIWRHLPPPFVLINEVHDEILLDSPDVRCAKLVRPGLREMMTKGVQLKLLDMGIETLVDYDVDINIGKSWKDAKDG